jgi:hypothetical protein
MITTKQKTVFGIICTQFKNMYKYINFKISETYTCSCIFHYNIYIYILNKIMT